MTDATLQRHNGSQLIQCLKNRPGNVPAAVHGGQQPVQWQKRTLRSLHGFIVLALDLAGKLSLMKNHVIEANPIWRVGRAMTEEVNLPGLSEVGPFHRQIQRQDFIVHRIGLWARSEIWPERYSDIFHICKHLADANWGAWSTGMYFTEKLA
jgi:hypothetical protein